MAFRFSDDVVAVGNALDSDLYVICASTVPALPAVVTDRDRVRRYIPAGDPNAGPVCDALWFVKSHVWIVGATPVSRADGIKPEEMLAALVVSAVTAKASVSPVFRTE